MIVIAPYDPAWPTRFVAESERIRQAFATHALRIEHVGSTAVPGLPAKPIIDIQVSVPSLEPRDLFHSRLVSLGYAHFSLGAFDLVYPFYKRPAEWPRTHHVHLCAPGSEQERNHIAFRDYLRRNPAVAAEYASHKQKFASAMMV